LDDQARDELYIFRRAGDLAHFEKERIRQTLGLDNDSIPFASPDYQQKNQLGSRDAGIFE